MSSRPLSLLDGKYSYEWAKYVPHLGVETRVGRLADQLAVQVKTPAHHFCPCGLVTAYCAPCDEWVCSAPGHLKHVCRSAR